MTRALILLMILPLSLGAQPKVDVVFPSDGQHLPAGEAHFIYGRVSPSHAKLHINGRPVAVYHNGAFIAYLPVSPGAFAFRMTLAADGDSAAQILPVFIASDPIDADEDSIESIAAGPGAPLPWLPARVLPAVARIDLEDEDETLFLQGGTRLFIDGRRGDSWRVALSASLTGWIHAGDFYWLPGPGFAAAAAGPVAVRDRGNTTRIAVTLGDRLPFRVIQPHNPQRLLLAIWGAADLREGSGPIPAAGVVRKAAWQRSPDALTLSLDLNIQQQWGYAVHFSSDTLVLELRHPPRIDRGTPLADRLILLDPGHHPDQGAVGPTRLEERAVNWAIADRLKSMLEARGSRVIVSRTAEHGATILARTQIAALTRPDVVVSIHNNALPEGSDPTLKRGTSTFYYHRHSRRLAEIIQRNLAGDIELRDHGVRTADLAMCRLTGMPAVLVECAFMMLPQQEYLLGNVSFQDRIARSLLRSLEQYFRRYAV